MNLGWVGTDPEITDIDMGVILHEFGHALGLVHEHQSFVHSQDFSFDPGGEVITLVRSRLYPKIIFP